MIQILLILICFLGLILPMGKYLYRLALEKSTTLDRVFDPIDRFIYKVLKLDLSEMTWKRYTLAMLVTNALMAVVSFMILKVQWVSLFNPNAAPSMESTLAFNTVISFMTNTNLQHYSGETALSYLSQCLVIIFLMFTSAASGFSVCMAFIRGLSTKGGHLGNFYKDMVRITTRVLIPLSILVSVLLISQGVPQNFKGNLTIDTLEGSQQDLVMGPIAALESIKHLGTNGGGFMGANSATPLENPTILSNMIEILSMMLLPGAIVIAFGYMLMERMRRRTDVKFKRFHPEILPIFAVMSVLFLVGLGVCLAAESAGNPLLESVGLSQSQGNMEGKELRFGVTQSALFTVVTTAFTTGTVNNMHDTLTPLGGAVPLINMMLNVVFGGKGVGLMNLILYALMTVFICSLMVGRTPEYLGKKIEGHEMKLATIGIIVHPLLILAASAIAVSTAAGLAGISNPGFHGLSQVLYEFSSSAANNGSGFEGLMDNTPFWNISTGLVMLFGRYISIIIQLAIAGALMAKPYSAESIGALRTDTFTFGVSLLMIVIIIVALTFLPAIALGPIAEHLVLYQ